MIFCVNLPEFTVNSCNQFSRLQLFTMIFGEFTQKITLIFFDSFLRMFSCDHYTAWENITVYLPHIWGLTTFFPRPFNVLNVQITLNERWINVLCQLGLKFPIWYRCHILLYTICLWSDLKRGLNQIGTFGLCDCYFILRIYRSGYFPCT